MSFDCVESPTDHFLPHKRTLSVSVGVSQKVSICRSPIISCKPQRREHRCKKHCKEHDRDGRLAQILDPPKIARGAGNLAILS